LRLVSAGSGFASQNTERLYFGLNDQTRVDVLTVRWPSGRIETFKSIGDQLIAADRLVRITEGAGIEQAALPTK